MDYALSREEKNKKGGKMYIQDKVEEYADEIFERLQNGAVMYFCGLKGMMPGTISASRCVEVPSRHRCDSCPSHHEVGGFFFDSERHGAGVVEAPSPRRQDGEIGVVRAGGTSLDIRRAELAPDLELRQTPAPHAHWMEREIVEQRRPVVFLLRSYSSPSHEAVGGLIFDFERISGEIVSHTGSS